MTTICSWCGTIIKADNEQPDITSHGLCIYCYDEIMRKIKDGSTKLSAFISNKKGLQ